MNDDITSMLENWVIIMKERRKSWKTELEIIVKEEEKEILQN